MTDATRSAWAWCLATVHTTGDVLDAWFPEPHLGTDLTDEPSSTLAEAQVHATLCGEFDAPPDRIGEDLLALVGQLSDAGLVQVSPGLG